MKDRVNILGTEYQLLEQNDSENPKLKEANGLCEHYSKKIIVASMEQMDTDVMVVENLEEYQNKVLRHEIVHAYLGESGLRSNSDWAENEEMVDWIAIQAPKIFKTFSELGLL